MPILEFNGRSVVVLRLQTKTDRFGNTRNAYVVNYYDGEPLKIFIDNPEGNAQLKAMFPDFVRPTFTVAVEVAEFKKYIKQAKYL